MKIIEVLTRHFQTDDTAVLEEDDKKVNTRDKNGSVDEDETLEQRPDTETRKLSRGECFMLRDHCCLNI